MEVQPHEEMKTLTNRGHAGMLDCEQQASAASSIWSGALSLAHGQSGGRRRLISACEAPPPRPFCKPLGPPAPLVAIPLEVVQGPTQLVVAGPNFAEELLNG